MPAAPRSPRSTASIHGTQWPPLPRKEGSLDQDRADRHRPRTLAAAYRRERLSFLPSRKKLGTLPPPLEVRTNLKGPNDTWNWPPEITLTPRVWNKFPPELHVSGPGGLLDPEGWVGLRTCIPR